MTMCTQGAEHITAVDFKNWLAAARPGDRIVYCKGLLAASIAIAFQNKDPNAPQLNTLQETTWQARDKVHLVQRRVGPKVFDYLAIRATDRFPA
jgi:hypothetical protein